MLAILAAALLAATPAYDTVFIADGGRVLGTVVEDGPNGVTIQVADGTLRHFEPRDVTKVIYADGSVSTPGQQTGPQQAPPPQQPAPAPQQAQPAPPMRAYPPAYPPYPPSRPPRRAPPPYEPGYAARRGGGPISPIYGAFGLGALSLSGDVESGVSTSRVFSSQLDVWLEGGVRLTPEIGLGLYADIGVGDPSAEVRATCNGVGETCTATTGRVGVLLRRTFDPAAPTNTWLAIGTGFDFGSVSTNGNDGMGSSELFSYSGWEMLRLMGGVDLRSNQVIGVGLYAGVSVGRYSTASDVNGDVSLDRATHTLVEGGIRFTLFP